MKADNPASAITFTHFSQVEAAKRELIAADGWTVVDLNEEDNYFGQPMYLLYW